MGLIVQKFGGSSVADVDKMKLVAGRVIAECDRGNQVVVVVSAMGKTTDNLLSLIAQVTDRPNPREVDMVLATGEQISIAILALVLQTMGRKAISMTGPQVGIITDPFHRKARIRDINTARLREKLDEGHIVIVAGFQGLTQSGQITTLGRGGSDTTDVALAAALHADRCDIYTDVDGVYTTDPRIVPDARKLATITFDEMLELASLGAKVLHNRSVELARNHNVPLQVLSTFSQNPGTLVVKEYTNMEDIVVSGVAYNRDEYKITILGVPDQPGMAAKLFSKIGEANVNIDIIVQNISHRGLSDISFTVGKEDFQNARDVAEQFVKEYGAEGIRTDDAVGKVSIVGVGMRSHGGIAATMFGALAKENINIQMISTSEIKISVVIARADVDRAVQAIHREFELQSEPKLTAR
ncbi:MAG: Aspartokinase [candidate division BRC1 bacterium ADurb.BinA292]|nr:MAG: Aspartokinase [candidate division BRC1 bacterium ADurb.BinA292]